MRFASDAMIAPESGPSSRIAYSAPYDESPGFITTEGRYSGYPMTGATTSSYTGSSPASSFNIPKPTSRAAQSFYDQSLEELHSAGRGSDLTGTPWPTPAQAPAPPLIIVPPPVPHFVQLAISQRPVQMQYASSGTPSRADSFYSDSVEDGDPSPGVPREYTQDSWPSLPHHPQVASASRATLHSTQEPPRDVDGALTGSGGLRGRSIYPSTSEVAREAEAMLYDGPRPDHAGAHGVVSLQSPPFPQPALSGSAGAVPLVPSTGLYILRPVAPNTDVFPAIHPTPLPPPNEFNDADA